MAPLEDAELAQLAPKISFSSMKSIAIQRMGFTGAEISSLVSEHREDTEGFRRQILTQWRNKNQTDSRRVSLKPWERPHTVHCVKEVKVLYGNLLHFQRLNFQGLLCIQNWHVSKSFHSYQY